MAKVNLSAVCALVLGVVSMAARAQIPGLEPEKRWDLNGYVKYMATYTVPDQANNGLDHLLHQRFNFEYRFDHGLRFNASMRNRVFVGDSLDNPHFGNFVAFDNGYMDLSKNVKESDSVVINSQLDRLFLDWQGEQWRARVGRFRINWAMNTIWNPNDLFNAYSIYDFDYAEKQGSDALMIGRKLGFADGAEWVVNPNQDGELNSYAARYYGNSRGWDYQFVAGKSHLDNVLGIGFATDWQGAGVRGELTWFSPRKDWYKGAPQEKNTVASLETDYSFGGKRSWLARAAWLYIENPTNVANAQLYLSLPLNAKTLSFTHNTVYLDVSFDFSALNRMTISTSYYQDESYFIGLSNAYSLANDWQILMVLQRFDGGGSSLFGQTASTLLYANIKWSF